MYAMLIMPPVLHSTQATIAMTCASQNKVIAIFTIPTTSPVHHVYHFVIVDLVSSADVVDLCLSPLFLVSTCLYERENRRST